MVLRTIVVIEAFQENGCIVGQLGLMTLGETAKMHTPGYYTIISTLLRRLTDPEKAGSIKAKQSWDGKPS